MHTLSLVTVVWSTLAAAAGLLGLMYLMRWVLDRQATVDLTFSIVAFAFVANTITELNAMYAATPEEWGAWIKISHVPLAVMVIGTIVFVRQYLGTGRLWLAVTVIGMRVLILAINLVSHPNFNFARIDSIARVDFLGETVTTVGESVVGRWQVLGLLSSILLAAYALDAAVSLWRHGGAENRRRAAVIGGALFLFVSVASLSAQLVIFDRIDLPVLITPSFTLMLLAMSFELSRYVLRATRLAREVEEGRRRLELAAEAANVGLYEWDSQSGRSWVSQRAREIFALSEVESPSPQNWMERIHAEDFPQVEAAVRTALEQGTEQELEFRVCAPGRETRWVLASGRVDRSGVGIGTRMRGVVRDVTAQREALRETQELRRELAHASRVSTLGQLASSLAHELSQPLGAILRNTEAADLLLHEPQADLEELRSIVADMHRDTQRAGDVIDRLRAMLKRSKVEPQPIALEGLISDVNALVRADAVARHVAINWSTERDLPRIKGDRVHLSQVLINLIINAMDAVMDREQASRRLAVATKRGGRGSIVIAVCDSGPGIPADHLARIFEPFFTTKSAGMGMGLSICRTIVNAHGGSLSAGNDPAGGAVFTIRLPCEEGSAP